jgi:peptide/nickel transport system substrate-binding protein
MQRLKAFAVLVVFALVVAACGGSDSGETTTTAGGDSGSQTTTTATSSDAGNTSSTTAESTTATPMAHGGTLTLAVITDVTSWAAPQSRFGQNAEQYQVVYDSLLRVTPDYKIEPWLATDWSYNEDNTVLTMNLRDDVTFTDGTPFNADAAAQNIIRMRDGTGADASNLALVADAKAVDDYTLEIDLSEPNPALLGHLSRTSGLMESPANFGAADEDAHPIGSGPYIMDVANSTVGSFYTFNSNPDYWNPDVQYWDQVVFRVIGDPTAIVNALKAGEIDGAILLAKESAGDVESAGLSLVTWPLDWYGFSFVDRDGSMGTPLGDIRVRQAINMALDREAIANAIGLGYGEPTNQVFSPSSAGYHPELESMYAYDVEGAKALMQEAGYGDGFTLNMPVSSRLSQSIYAIAADSLGQIGITVNHVEEGSDFITALLTPKYPAFFMSLEQNPNDFAFIQFLLAENAVWNPGHYTDEKSADLIRQIQYATDDTERNALVSELGQYVLEQAWYAPWMRPLQVYAYNGDVVNVEAQVGNAVPFIWNFTPAG